MACTLTLHVRKREADAVHGAQQVRLDQRAPDGWITFGRQLLVGDAGIGHQNVEPPEASHGAVDQLLDGLRIAHVHLDRFRESAGLLDGADRRGQADSRQRGQAQASTETSERYGDGGADATPGPGDDANRSRRCRHRPPRISSAMRSPIIIAVALVLARTQSGMMEASATRKPSMPRTRPA